MQKLTIVNCTDRKSVAPEADLRIRSIPAGALSNVSHSGDAGRPGQCACRTAQPLPGRCLAASQGACDRRPREWLLRPDACCVGGTGLRDVTTSAPSYAQAFAVAITTP